MGRVKIKLYSVFCFVFFFFQESLFAQVLQESTDAKIILSNCSLREVRDCSKDICKIYVFSDKAFLFKNCKLRPLEDSAVTNILIEKYKFIPKYLPRETYSALPLGQPFRQDDFLKDFILKNDNLLGYYCKNYENKIVSADGEKFYLIEDCKKRKFENSREVSPFVLNKGREIVSIPVEDIDIFPNGPVMPFRNITPSLNVLPKESEVQANLPSQKALCSQLKSRIVSFRGSFFEVINCTLFQKGSLSLKEMLDAEKKGGIQELSLQQRLGLPKGNVTELAR